MPASHAEQLAAIRDELSQEAARLQVVGRALTRGEQDRIDAIHQVIPLLDRAAAVLAGHDHGLEAGRGAVLPGVETYEDYPGTTRRDDDARLPDEESAGLPGDETTIDYSEPAGAEG